MEERFVTITVDFVNSVVSFLPNLVQHLRDLIGNQSHFPKFVDQIDLSGLWVERAPLFGIDLLDQQFADLAGFHQCRVRVGERV